jgi:hypothetical protein
MTKNSWNPSFYTQEESRGKFTATWAIFSLKRKDVSGVKTAGRQTD